MLRPVRRALTLACALALAAALPPAPAAAQCTDGTVMGYGCAGYTWQGCCAGGNVLYWCENGYTCRLSCNADPSCGWDPYASKYQCGTAGLAAPSNDPPFDCSDGDGDTYTPPSDCDDTDPAIHPDAPEQCDGVDNDCDGHDDNGFDADGDGFPDGSLPECAANLPPELLDCDDTHSSANPDAEDVPYDGVDQDCDGTDLTDVDGDGYDGGTQGDDCDDFDGDINPGADENCEDGFDNDCDGLVDATDPECGPADDDDDDDDASGDDDAGDDAAAPDDDTGDDDTAGDDDASAASTFEPLGFGCSCRLARVPRGSAAAAVALTGVLFVGWRRRRAAR